MTEWEKLVELLKNTEINKINGHTALAETCFTPNVFENMANNLIANGVTVREHGYLETVVEVKDNTVCGNGVKIEYKRCSCCKNPAKFFEDDFCGNCGAKLDLPQPPKEE